MLFFNGKLWYTIITYNKGGIAMNYAEQLYEVVDKYLLKVVMPYGVKNSEAAVYLKKFTPFKKKNFDEYVQAYNAYKNAAEALTMGDIDVPEEDEKAIYLKECFAQSQKSFAKLCGRNADFYDFQNRKARHESVNAKELKEIFVALQASMNSAGRDVEALEKAYKQLKLDTDPEYAKAVAEGKEKI